MTNKQQNQKRRKKNFKTIKLSLEENDITSTDTDNHSQTNKQTSTTLISLFNLARIPPFPIIQISLIPVTKRMRIISSFFLVLIYLMMITFTTSKKILFFL